MQLAMIQDKIMALDELAPAQLDRGLYFGDGVYEVLRSYHGNIFALEDHLQRLAYSLDAVCIGGIAIETVRRRIITAFDQARIQNARIYLHVTRGSAPRNHVCDDHLAPNFLLTVTELPDDTRAKNSGIAVTTHPDWRWKRCDIKSLNLLPNVLARLAAAKKGADEAIFVDDAGLITEGAGSAFFALTGRRLATAPLSANILASVTRKFVLRAAENLGIAVLEESLRPAHAACADELFIAVTTRDIVPVVKFDDKTIADGKVGKYTKLLIDEFLTFT